MSALLSINSSAAIWGLVIIFATIGLGVLLSPGKVELDPLALVYAFWLTCIGIFLVLDSSFDEGANADKLEAERNLARIFIVVLAAIIIPRTVHAIREYRAGRRDGLTAFIKVFTD